MLWHQTRQLAKPTQAKVMEFYAFERDALGTMVKNDAGMRRAKAVRGLPVGCCRCKGCQQQQGEQHFCNLQRAPP